MDVAAFSPVEMGERLHPLLSLAIPSLHPPAQFFDRTAFLFVIDHAPFDPSGPRAILPADFLPVRALRRFFRPARFFQRLKQTLTGDLPVHRLRAGILHSHRHAAWHMAQRDSRGDLVDMLAARPGGTREALRDVLCAQPQPGESHSEIGWRSGGGWVHGV